MNSQVRGLPEGIRLIRFGAVVEEDCWFEQGDVHFAVPGGYRPATPRFIVAAAEGYEFVVQDDQSVKPCRLLESPKRITVTFAAGSDESFDLIQKLLSSALRSFIESEYIDE